MEKPYWSFRKVENKIFLIIDVHTQTHAYRHTKKQEIKMFSTYIPQNRTKDLKMLDHGCPTFWFAWASLSEEELACAAYKI